MNTKCNVIVRNNSNHLVKKKRKKWTPANQKRKHQQKLKMRKKEVMPKATNKTKERIMRPAIVHVQFQNRVHVLALVLNPGLAPLPAPRAKLPIILARIDPIRDRAANLVQEVVRPVVHVQCRNRVHALLPVPAPALGPVPDPALVLAPRAKRPIILARIDRARVVNLAQEVVHPVVAAVEVETPLVEVAVAHDIRNGHGVVPGNRHRQPAVQVRTRHRIPVDRAVKVVQIKCPELDARNISSKDYDIIVNDIYTTIFNVFLNIVKLQQINTT